MTKPTQTVLRAAHGGRRFRIEFGGEGIGYYLYVYDGERCTHDYLQDTLDIARRFALERLGVPTESWTDADERPLD
ncbi:MAG: hypothetical protein EBY09_22040 [Verrucomicrobia bacterium]|nr:hypothetical protein [Verrucomicrobiota bacterium]NBU08111.1 hypothetical protein [Pseudomonadota bacterium]NDA69273.1 hypothetical protein [Verrucomicrobiota bacterium]NDD40935.1 hypothetical protein [Verrucomicrobiota bacterium]NDF01231.1 hypothetical protein [Verrucomicrobiota bacterium]